MFSYRRETPSLFSSAPLLPPALVILDYFLLHFLHASGFSSVPGSQVFVELSLLPSLTGLTKEPAALDFTLFPPQLPDSRDYSILWQSSLFLGYELQCPLLLSKFSCWSVAKGLLIVLLPNIYFAFPFVLFFSWLLFHRSLFPCLFWFCCCLFVFGDRVSIGSPDWPKTQGDPPASTSCELEWKACTTMPSSFSDFSRNCLFTIFFFFWFETKSVPYVVCAMSL